MPLDCCVLLAICCDGMRGACIADNPDAAGGPDVAELTACVRAAEMPVAGSALPGGHSPLVCFFRTTQLPASGGAIGVFPFVVVCTGGATTVAVDVEEAFDASEDEEFCR